MRAAYSQIGRPREESCCFVDRPTKLERGAISVGNEREVSLGVGRRRRAYCNSWACARPGASWSSGKGLGWGGGWGWEVDHRKNEGVFDYLK